jgi:hypothetical protein
MYLIFYISRTHIRMLRVKSLLNLRRAGAVTYFWCVLQNWSESECLWYTQSKEAFTIDWVCLEFRAAFAMLRQGSVGWQVSRSSQHDPFKHTLSSYLREHSASINIARRHNLGNSSLSRDGWHHHSQSPHVTMAVSHPLTQTTNPGNAIPSTVSSKFIRHSRL